MVVLRVLPLAILALLLTSTRAAAAFDRLCDPAHENCRAPLLDLINTETQGIDVAFWFMEDTRYSSALIAKHRAGVPVRVVIDNQSFSSYPASVKAVTDMRDAGIPIRNKSGGKGILHFKMMLFRGHNMVEFSGANYSDEAFVPRTAYVNYVDEVILFTGDPSIVDSFKTRYDDIWMDTVMFSNYANITTPLARRYPTSAIDPEMNFVPWQNFRTRSVTAYKAETVKIDSIMYRITDRAHSDQMIAAVARGVPVRLITEPVQYRDPTRLWHAWNVDRMYVAGVQIRHRYHAGLSHEKLTMLYGQNMTVLGSSNWTSPSADAQHEHNLFTKKAWIFEWSRNHFERKWNNTAPAQETQPFAPLPPDVPQMRLPANGAQNQPTTVSLRWYGGPWAHRYDVYFGPTPDRAQMTKVVNDVELGPSLNTSANQSFTVSSLAAGTTYYWQVVSRTMAGLERTGPMWSFRTTGSGPVIDPSDVVLWASRATTRPGWAVTADSSAAGGSRLANANAGAAKLSAPLASPSQYFDLGFTAEAGVPYRLWIRGKATSNNYNNDSVYVQFSGSVTSSGTPTWRIGSTSATTVTIEDCSGCGLQEWGWQDNGYGAGVMGPAVYFATTGAQTIRVQVREDGLSIDQIILSRATFLNSPPGGLKNDGSIYAEQGGSSTGGTPTPTPAPTATLPDGWGTADIGSVAAGGSASEAGGTFTLDGSGADIWGTADEFRFAWRSLTGDGTIVARVATLQNVDVWTKGGVMLRDSLAAGSRHVSVFVTPGKGLAFQRRLTTSGTSVHTSGALVTAPRWLKLERRGDVITAFTSADGSAWEPAGSETLSLPATIHVGLVVSSHRDGTLARATFDNVLISN